MRRLAALLAVLVLAVSVQASVIDVPTDFTAIQQAIDASSNGDTVLVAPGTYTENIDFGNKDIVLSSSGGAGETFLHPFDADLPIISIKDTTVRHGTVYGFTFENATHVALDVNKAAVLIRNNVFRNINTNTHEGAIKLDVSYYSRVDSNMFYDISANRGAAIRIINCRMDTIAYNLVYDVSGSASFHTYGCNGIFFHNNTLVNGNGDGIENTYSTLPEIRNNIVVGFVNGNGIELSQINNYSIDYNCTFNNKNNYSGSSYVGPNDIAVDPLFIDPLFLNYNLTSISPCVDAGDPNAFFNDPDGTRGDIGAFYSDQNFPGLYEINFGPSAVDSTVYLLPPTFYWTYYDAVPGTQSAYEVEVGSDADWTTAEIWSSGEVSSTDEFADYGGPALTRGETYYLRIRVSNGSAWSYWVESRFYISTSVVILVPGAVPTIQAGIDLASNGDTVLVAAGTYSGSGNRDLNFNGKNITLLSEAGANSTIIDCEGTDLDPHRGFIFTNGESIDAVVHGFSIINGYAPQEGGMHRGGAVYCENSSPFFKYCKFEQCSGEQGGVFYGMNTQSEFTYSTFSNTITDQEGAFYLSASDFIIDNCVFTVNVAANGGAVYALNSVVNFNGSDFDENQADFGGAVYSDNTTLNFTDCEFETNSSQEGGAVYSIGLGGSYNQCTFKYQQSSTGGAIYLDNSDPQISSCTFMENYGILNGGAIYGFMSHPDFSNVNFYANFSLSGGALYFDGGLDTGKGKLASDTVQILNCNFYGNLSDSLTAGTGGAIFWQWDDVRLEIEECGIISNISHLGGGLAVGGYVDLYMRNCTVVGNRGDQGAALYINPQDFTGVIDNTILAYNKVGEAVYCEAGTDLTLNCSDVYSNGGGDYTGCITSQAGINDNFSLNPVFCEESFYLVHDLSPCAPDNSPCGMLVGAYEPYCYNIICGDANNDTRVSVSDAVYIINYVFSGGNAPRPLATGDCNCDLKVNISDAVYIINYVFSGGHSPCDPNGDGQRDC